MISRKIIFKLDHKSIVKFSTYMYGTMIYLTIIVS